MINRIGRAGSDCAHPTGVQTQESARQHAAANRRLLVVITQAVESNRHPLLEQSERVTGPILKTGNGERVKEPRKTPRIYFNNYLEFTLTITSNSL